MCAPLHSGGAVAGVARRTQRLFEIIRQLPALLGPDSSLLLSSLPFSSPLSGFTSAEQQLQTAGSESYSDISSTAVLSPWPVPENRGFRFNTMGLLCFIPRQWLWLVERLRAQSVLPILKQAKQSKRYWTHSNVFAYFTPGRQVCCCIFNFFSRFAPALLWVVSVYAHLHCSLVYVGLIVQLAGKRPLIVVTKTSGSYSHSNQNISFPRVEYINYAFLLQDLYFLRQELECMLNFLLSTRAAPPTASPLQLLPRQLIEKCSVAWRILIHSYLCTHITLTHTHTLVMVLCTCLCASVCAFRACVYTLCHELFPNTASDAVLLLIQSYSSSPYFLSTLLLRVWSKRLHIIRQPVFGSVLEWETKKRQMREKGKVDAV